MAEIPPHPQPTVEAIWRAREEEAAARPRHEAWGVSASALGTPCDRQLWLNLRWASEQEVVDGRRLRIFERGEIEEGRVIDDLRRAGVEISREQERFAMADGWLRGKIDAVGVGFLEASKTAHVVEVKSAKAADFRAVVKHGVAKAKPEHWHQIHAGMAATGLQRGAYVIVNKDTEEIWIERVGLDAEEAARQEARVLRLVAEHDAPSRIADEPKGPPCLFCAHKALCFERAAPRRNCRTCVFFTFKTGGNGHCERWDEPRTPQRQQEGATCPTFLYLPSLVDGEQIDAADDMSWIEYRLADGTIWRDGGENA